MEDAVVAAVPAREEEVKAVADEAPLALCERG